MEKKLIERLVENWKANTDVNGSLNQSKDLKWIVLSIAILENGVAKDRLKGIIK